MKTTSVSALFIFVCLLFVSSYASAQKINQKDWEKLQSDYQKLQNKKDSLNQEIGGLKQKIQDLEKKQTPNNSNCTAELQKKDDEISKLKVQLAEAQKNQSGSGTNKDEVEALRKERDLFKAQVENYRKERDEFKTQAEASKTEAEALRKERDLFKAQVENYRKERDEFKTQAEASKTEAETLRKERDIAKTNSDNARIQAASCQNELTELKKQFSTTTLEQENDVLRKAFLAEIDAKIAQLLLRSDFAAAKQEAQQLKNNINAMEARKKFPQSTNVYLGKLEAYEKMIATIEASKRVLDNPYTLETVSKTSADITTVLTSVLVKPTIEQEKLLKEQEALLKAYCGRHNYVCGKISDADAFGTDKKGATEEIDAALSRLDKNYTFLIRKLEERKKDPTNKTITLSRVPCSTN